MPIVLQAYLLGKCWPVSEWIFVSAIILTYLLSSEGKGMKNTELAEALDPNNNATTNLSHMAKAVNEATSTEPASVREEGTACEKEDGAEIEPNILFLFRYFCWHASEHKDKLVWLMLINSDDFNQSLLTLSRWTLNSHVISVTQRPADVYECVATLGA